MKAFRSLLVYFIFVLVIALPPFFLMQAGITKLIIPRFWAVFFYISASTFMLLALMLVVQRFKKQLYAQAFLAGTIVKMIGLFLFALLYIKKVPANPAAFLCSFFYTYFLNLVFEISALLSNLRRQIQE